MTGQLSASDKVLSLFPNLPAYFFQTPRAVERIAKFIEDRGSDRPEVRGAATSYLKVRSEAIAEPTGAQRGYPYE